MVVPAVKLNNKVSFPHSSKVVDLVFAFAFSLGYTLRYKHSFELFFCFLASYLLALFIISCIVASLVPGIVAKCLLHFQHSYSHTVVICLLNLLLQKSR